MENIKVIWQNGPFRIIEVVDLYCSMVDLKGDCFNPEVNSDIDLMQLRREEVIFERKVEREGVFGYVLEAWNPEVGKGYQSVDSCWGFVGQFEDEAHYIVEEFIKQASE